MTPQELADIVRYRLERADETAAAAERNPAQGDAFTAANRIYYAMFYAANALALVHGFKTSHHAQLLGWFNKNFVAAGHVTAEDGEAFREAFRIRTKGDYDALVSLDVTLLRNSLPQMKKFIARMRELVQSGPTNSPTS